MNDIFIKTSTIKDGDMRHSSPSSPQVKFLKKNKISKMSLITMHQMHSNSISFVSGNNRGKKIKNSDGLLTTEKNTTLAVFTADCLPIVLYDKKNKLLGVLHAGYKGVLKGIIKKALTKFQEKSSNPSDIKIHIGPSIDKCCYHIDSTRHALFAEKFPLNGEVEKRNHKIYISLKKVAENEFKRLGVPQSNISISQDCTSCSKKYFSYRRQGKIEGLNMTVAGIKS